MAGAIRQRDELLQRLAGVITVELGLQAGDPETRISVDHLLPNPDENDDPRARWRLRTLPTKLYGSPIAAAALEALHGVDANKGRRLGASDLQNDNRVAAVIGWHFATGRRQGTRQPHLITAAAVRTGTSPEVRAEDMVAIWILMNLVLAIDGQTINRGQIGLVLDGGIGLSEGDLRSLDWKPGPDRGGYAGDYWILSR